MNQANLIIKRSVTKTILSLTAVLAVSVLAGLVAARHAQTHLAPELSAQARAEAPVQAGPTAEGSGQAALQPAVDSCKEDGMLADFLIIKNPHKEVLRELL